MKNVLFILVAVAAIAFVVGPVVADHIGHHGCKACHVPHGADLVTSGVPLWNPAAVSGEEFTMYNGADSVTAMFAKDDISAVPTGSSMLCLSCHDGVGSGYIGSNHAAGTGTNIGTDLQTVHPVSFKYQDTLDAIAGTAGARLEYKEVAELPVGFLDRNGEVQCSSCHDVHLEGGRVLDQGTTYAGSAIPWQHDSHELVDDADPSQGYVQEDYDPILRGDGRYFDGAGGGALCLQCHIKGINY